MQCMNLKCPNLLTIFDLKANDAGDTFVVMEYVAGPSLASVLSSTPAGCRRPRSADWLKGLVEGVAYLHDHGIVHRDLKPANLFMEEGIVKIGDYGLAKLITPSQGTEHSESIGTCHYMAPEIGSGKYNKPIDVYAMGVILYEMLTGRVPFDGETVNEVLMKHLTARPDVSMLPEPYRSIVARALAKDPNRAAGRVYDLLPPEDVPREPEVRIIGDAKAGGAGPRPAAGRRRRRTSCGSRPRSRCSTSAPRRGRPAVRADPGAAAAGQLAGLRRPTRPGKRGAARPAWQRGRSRRRTSLAPGSRSLAEPPPRRPVPVRRAVAPAPAARPRPRRPCRRPCPAAGSASPSWPPRCSGRPRSWPCWPSPPPPRWRSTRRSDPQQLAYLYVMALLGTWTALIPGKVARDASARLGRPPVDRRGGRVAHRLRRAPSGAGPAARPGPAARVLRASPSACAVLLRGPVRDHGRLVVPDGPRPPVAVPHPDRPLDRPGVGGLIRSGRTSGRTTSPSRP